MYSDDGGMGITKAVFIVFSAKDIFDFLNMYHILYYNTIDTSQEKHRHTLPTKGKFMHTLSTNTKTISRKLQGFQSFFSQISEC